MRLFCFASNAYDDGSFSGAPSAPDHRMQNGSHVRFQIELATPLDGQQIFGLCTAVTSATCGIRTDSKQCFLFHPVGLIAVVLAASPAMYNAVECGVGSLMCHDQRSQIRRDHFVSSEGRLHSRRRSRKSEKGTAAH